MALVLVTPPIEEPVSLDEAQAHLRVEGSEDGLLVERLIKAARQRVETVTWRALCTQTWDLVLDSFPSTIQLPKGTVSSIGSVTYYDSANVLRTLASDQYLTDCDSIPARIAPVSSWPATYERPGAVRVRFVCGYGRAEDVPEDLKQAILLLVGHFYENREPEIVAGSISRFELAVDALCAPHSVRRFE